MRMLAIALLATLVAPVVAAEELGPGVSNPRVRVSVTPARRGATVAVSLRF